MPRTKKTVTITQDEYQTLLSRLDDLGSGQNEIKLELASRKHIDETVAKHEEIINGNGKPGFVAIRDKVLAWDAKISAITLLVLGDVVVRLVFFAASTPK